MRGPRIKRYGSMALDALTEANQDRPFADLVTPLVPAAQRLAYGMLQNAQDSEDAGRTHKTVKTRYRRLHSKPGAPFRACAKDRIIARGSSQSSRTSASSGGGIDGGRFSSWPRLTIKIRLRKDWTARLWICDEPWPACRPT